MKSDDGLDDCGAFLAQHLEDQLFSLSDDKIFAVVGHVPKLTKKDFLFLNGFTYFMGVWIDFEQVCKKLFENDASIRKPFVVYPPVFQALKNRNLLQSEDIERLRELSNHRNKLVHGEISDIPYIAEIEFLSNVTDRLRQVQQ